MPGIQISSPPQPHPSLAVLEKLAEFALDGTLQGNTLLAAARLLCQDRWHQEKLALAQAKLKLQEEKEAQTAKQNRRELRLKRAYFALKIKEYKLKKQVQIQKEAENELIETLPNISFQAAKPSDQILQLKNDLGVRSGGVVSDARLPLYQTEHSAPLRPPDY